MRSFFPAKRISYCRLTGSMRLSGVNWISPRSGQGTGSALQTGRGLEADAVMTVAASPEDQQSELVIQLISLTDGRICSAGGRFITRGRQMEHGKKASFPDARPSLSMPAGKKAAPVY